MENEKTPVCWPTDRSEEWGPDWTCWNCKTVNYGIREKCRSCGYDSNAGEFPWYNPLPPYNGLPSKTERTEGEK